MSEASPHTILVVEDEVIVATDLEHSLRQLGYRVLESATSREEALARASESRPDLVLMDVRLHGAEDGIETADQLKRRFQVPVVYLTAYADALTLERAKRTEPLGYLVKPVKPAELRSTVEIALYRSEVEREQRTREAWRRATLDSIADAVVCTDGEARVTFLNPAAERLIALPSHEALGRDVDEVIVLEHEDGHRPFEPPVRRVLREDGAAMACHQNVLVAHDGRRSPIDETVARVVCDGGVLGAVMVLRDLTDRRNLEQKVQRAARLSALGSMAAGVAHEVNNPLSIVVGSADLGLRSLSREYAAARDASRPLLEGLGQRFEDILQAALRIRDVVVDLGVFAPIASAPSGSADVARAVMRAAQNASHALRQRARLVQKVESVQPVRTSETRLVQVLTSLLLNAAQAIEPGHAEEQEVRVVVRQEAHDMVLLEVSDTGAGMTSEVRARIFEPFFTTKPVGSGTGLGLSVVHGIVSAAGGSIDVESAPRRGSTFRVRLPSMLADGGSEPGLTAEGRVHRGRRVLLLDEDPALGRVLAALIEAPHRVHACTRPDEVVALLAAGQTFDIILCDVAAGVAFFERLRAAFPEQSARVVFVSAGAFTPGLSALLEAHPHPCLTKPLTRALLTALLDDDALAALPRAH